MKNAFSIVVVLFVYLTGTFGVFTTCFQSYHQAVFQKEVLQQDQDETTEIFFNAEQYKALSWKERGKEFEWQGDLYDVNKIVQTKSGYIIYCENDVFEKIISSFFRSLKKEMERGTTNLNVQPQFFESSNIFTFHVNHLTKETLTSEIPVFYSPIWLRVFAPPPDSFKM